MEFHPDEVKRYKKIRPDLETIIREGKLASWIKERLLFDEYDPASQLTMEPDIIGFDHSYNGGASSPTAPINYFIKNGYAKKIFEQAAVLMEEIATNADVGHNQWYLQHFYDTFFPALENDQFTTKEERRLYDAFYAKHVPRFGNILLDILLSQGVPSERESAHFGEDEERVVKLYLDTGGVGRIPEEKRPEVVSWFRNYIAKRQHWLCGFYALQQLIALYVNPPGTHSVKSILYFFD